MTQNKDCILNEIQGGTANRQLAVPVNANVDGTQIVLQNGVLLLKIPKQTVGGQGFKKITIV